MAEVIIRGTTLATRSHLMTVVGDVNVADKMFRRRPANHNTPTGRVVGEWRG